MEQLSQAVPLQLIKGRSRIGGTRAWREAEGLEAMSALQRCCKKTEQRYQSVKGGRSFGKHRTLSEIHPDSNYLRSEWWGKNIDSKGLGGNRHTNALYEALHSDVPHVEKGGRTWSSERFKRQH